MTGRVIPTGLPVHNGPMTAGSQGGRTGRFTFDAAADRWEWDDEVFRIHGLEPGTEIPSTDVVLRHATEPDDVSGRLRHAGRTGDPFSTSYLLKGADGVERQVLMVGEAGVCDDEGSATVEGYWIDLTRQLEEETEKAARQAVMASAESRADIEQAKGVLMLAYGLDADQAFAMLQWWSRTRNIKVRDLAARLMSVVGEREVGSADIRSGVDALLHDISSPA